ncbi:hypothetical protein CC1G_08397 [Coprinopsis cinerea okayama7|uniref:Uncharacterized protein n=1 Tax=Coprinopsis cinerea (strain Okayama-7 / 130 / ATCC MYA-4618 / FGSC 9003) TaxID=240176 RepID=A8NAM8_COPC7|nr:hypothetical protein CC1G_08397 [Coprinopsis cinerea okayama7\|eukprot:XP_001831880.1 hypothetical protein CC1G_08397 [Coprinopsis cinerea okayama7\
MGSAQSGLSSQLAITLVVVVGALGLGYTLRSAAPTQPAASLTGGSQKAQGSKKKKKKGTSAAAAVSQETTGVSTPASPNAHVVPFPEVIPGQFDSAPPVSDTPQAQSSSVSKSKKGKKKKAKGQAQDESATPVAQSSDERRADTATATTTTSSSKSKAQKSPKSKPGQKSSSTYLDLAGGSLHQSSASVDTDGSWTRVERRNKAGSAHQHSEATTSDAGITTSQTGNSSPVAERTELEEDETPSPNPRDSGENRRRTLAEKLLPKARKTGVEDLLDTPDVPTLSRVMRITPGPDEKPASGFSWGDYEDVRVTDGGENDADGEDDGWGVVKSKKSRSTRQASSSSPPPQASQSTTPQPPTKKQRQNAAKREAQKATKAAAEEERLAAQARHKRELERLRMAEQAKKSSSGKTVSGGMKATVDERGKLVWE